MTVTTTMLRHNRVDLALHTLREGAGRPLLLLHGLGEKSATAVPAWAEAWPGSIHALDFTGHGMSTLPAGGGYSAEILMADADIALAHLGESTVVGRGVGAYAALLLAGARPALVRGAVLCDGPGLWGGPSGPTSSNFVVLEPAAAAPDAYALLDLARDLRPPDYASLFARLAVQYSGLDVAIIVAATLRTPWLEAVVAEVGVEEGTIEEALAMYSAD